VRCGAVPTLASVLKSPLGGTNRPRPRKRPILPLPLTPFALTLPPLTNTGFSFPSALTFGGSIVGWIVDQHFTHSMSVARGVNVDVKGMVYSEKWCVQSH
jgi:hypothetical protein